ATGALYDLAVCDSATTSVAQILDQYWLPSGVGQASAIVQCASAFKCECFNGCNPITTCPAEACGPVPDGCGGDIDCGTCSEGQRCTADHTCCQPNACPAGACGLIDDGCGRFIDCGKCGCTRSTSCSADRQCGAFDDGCG